MPNIIRADHQGTDISKCVYGHKIKNGAHSYPSMPIYEDKLNELVLEIFKEFSMGTDQVLDIYLVQYLELMEDVPHLPAK